MKQEKEHELHENKMRFFTNISHELRTPLTLIAGPLNKLMNHNAIAKYDADFNNYFELMQRNVKRLVQLTNQLLDIRKLETGNMKLELYRGDLIADLGAIYEQFKPLAEKKNITFIFNSNLEKLETWFDQDKIEKIVTNLISNAIKFTEINGNIHLNINLINNDTNIEIKIKDSGIGIPQENLENIFMHFFQVKNTEINKNKGTGIGLALTRELILIHKGEIKAESEVDKGTTFTVTIPNGKKFYQPSELNDLHLENLSLDNNSDFVFNLKKTEPFINFISEQKLESTVLIIEDNDDLRFYLRTILNKKYIIKEASNGKEGLEVAFQNLPTIIISDVMMPEVDGMDLTDILKKDERTNHIPIVLLTALTDTDNKIKGLKLGADEYITKPFNEELLLVKVENLIKTRQILSERYRNQFTSLSPQDISLEFIDDNFVKKAISIVEKHISNSDFSVEVFATEIGMSYTVLYEKMKAIINQTPSDFVKSIRLKRAAQILSQKKLPLIDVAIMVGFNDPKYFSRCFRKQYGKTPSEFSSQAKD